MHLTSSGGINFPPEFGHAWANVLIDFAGKFQDIRDIPNKMPPMKDNKPTIPKQRRSKLRRQNGGGGE